MAFWEGEIKELDKLYQSFRGHLPDIVKELEQLIRTEDPNVVMLYSRRCLEVIITDLCESELKRPRKTEPLKGIIDKLNSEEKVPSHIIASMHSLNTMANYGAHPKDFDPEQVKPVLNNLSIIIRWYLKYKDFHVVSKPGSEEQKIEKPEKAAALKAESLPSKRKYVIPLLITGALLLVFIVFFILNRMQKEPPLPEVDPTRPAFVDQRDKQVYTEEKIGSQTWMGENLRATTLTDGTPLQLIKNDKEWADALLPAYCYYENNSVNKNTYGLLYNWFAVNTGKLCPVGWHVPSATEWNVLIKSVGDSLIWIRSGDSTILNHMVAGNKLKEAGNAHWKLNDTIIATDAYHFTALPGGERTVYGLFWGLGEMGCWWSSTIDGETDAENIQMDYNNSYVTEIQQYRKFGMSVRCLKDK